MEVRQIFVKLLDGRTHCLQIPSPTLSGEYLKALLSEKTGIPLALQRLVSGLREISEETLLSASDDGLFPSCALLLRLRGGKGGFGSLLRGAATKAGQKKTSNFDACRDMSGRRLRHVNAEKRLEEWQAEAEERRLEKIAEEFIRKKEKEARKKKGGGDAEKYLEKYREDAAKCTEAVEESVRESFQLYKESKRKVLPAAGPNNKRLKIWLGKKKVDESDSDEEDDEGGDEKSVVLDAGSSEERVKENEGSPGSVFGSYSDGESSGGGSAQSNLEEGNGKSVQVCMEISKGEGCGSGDSNADLDGLAEPEMEVNEEIATQEMMMVSSSKELMDSDESKSLSERPVEADAEMEKPVKSEVATEMPVESEATDKELVAQSISVSGLEEPLDFDKFDSGAELEVLGMERLKTELQTRGLKCGGTLQERAARLFLLKTTPLEKLPKKVFAKPAGDGK